MLTKINHIGVAVSSIEEALPYYRDSLGMTFSGTEEVPSQLVKVAFLSVGESKIELLEPTSPESPVAKFLEKNGPGVHHVAYGVEDIEAAIAKRASPSSTPKAAAASLPNCVKCTKASTSKRNMCRVTIS